MIRVGGACILDLDGARVFRAHTPLGNIRVMPAPIGDLASGIIVDPAKIDSAPCRAVGRPRGRSQPHVIVEPIGHGNPLGLCCGPAIIGNAAWQAASHGMQFSNAPIEDQLTRTSKIRVRPLLTPGLPDPVVACHSVGHESAVADGQGQRFLAIDVLACLGCIHGQRRVPVIGCGNLHRIDVRPRQDIAIVFIRCAAVVLIMPVDNEPGRLSPGNAAAPVSGALSVEITHRHNAHASVLHESPHVIGALVAGTDDGHGDLVARCVSPQHASRYDHWKGDQTG